MGTYDLHLIGIIIIVRRRGSSLATPQMKHRGDDQLEKFQPDSHKHGGINR
jgi:hypothetical protein